jgi:hypothetical protein
LAYAADHQASEASWEMTATRRSPIPVRTRRTTGCPASVARPAWARRLRDPPGRTAAWPRATAPAPPRLKPASRSAVAQPVRLACPSRAPMWIPPILRAPVSRSRAGRPGVAAREWSRWQALTSALTRALTTGTHLALTWAPRGEALMVVPMALV